MLRTVSRRLPVSREQAVVALAVRRKSSKAEDPLAGLGSVHSEGFVSLATSLLPSLPQAQLPQLPGPSQGLLPTLPQDPAQAASFIQEGLNHGFGAFGVPLQVSTTSGKFQEQAPLTKEELLARLKELHREAARIEAVLESQHGLRISAAGEQSGAFTANGAAARVVSAREEVAPAEQQQPKEAQDQEAELSADAAQRLQAAREMPEFGEEYEEINELERKLSKWYTIDADSEIPYKMMADVERYPHWMPWCNSGAVLESDAERGPTKVAVGIGMSVPFLGNVGDKIIYEARLSPPSAETGGCCGVYTACVSSIYAQELVYDWKFTPLPHGRTLVRLDLTFHAKAAWCVPFWETVRKQVVTGLKEAFLKEVKQLQRL